MKTIGKDKWPDWVKKVIGDKKNVEIKEQKGHYYAYVYKSMWDKEKKEHTRTSKYLGVVTPKTVKPPHEPELKGIYEYGNIKFVMDVLEENKLLKVLKNIFPYHWKDILVFAMNRLIDPRPIKAIPHWYEKTYLVKQLNFSISPKSISKTLTTVGSDWNSQHEFFQRLKQEGETVLYDGSLIFSSSKNNSLLEYGYNKEHFLLKQANILLAFSHDRFIPIFLRVIPGSIREINTIDILLKEIGKNVVLIADKGFGSENVFKKIMGVGFIIPLKRNSKKINYDLPIGSPFMYRDRPIKCGFYTYKNFFIYLYEDISLRAEEEKEYYTLLLRGKKVKFNENWAGKIALISNRKYSPQKAYEMWKSRGDIEKVFHILQNELDVDKPYVQKEETFRGYLFASFISLITYYFILNKLKKANLNDKISVSDVLLDLSKIYKIEVGRKEVLSETSKHCRKIIKDLNIKM